MKYLTILVFTIILVSVPSTSFALEGDSYYLNYYTTRLNNKIIKNGLQPQDVALAAVIYERMEGHPLAVVQLQTIEIYVVSMGSLPEEVWQPVSGARKAAVLSVMLSLGSRFESLEDFIAALMEQDYKTASVALEESNWCDNYNGQCKLVANIIRDGTVHIEWE